MNWTTEKPIRPGWYWFRPLADLAAEPEMVQVYEDNGVMYLTWPDDRTEELTNVRGEWAGPITGSPQ